MEGDIVDLQFNVENGSYEEFIIELSTALAGHPHRVSDIQKYRQHQSARLIESQPETTERLVIVSTKPP